MANNDTSIKKIFATKLTEFSTADKEGIGVIRREGAKTYKYVKYNQGVGTVAAVAGNMTAYKSDVSYGPAAAEVSSDVSDSLTVPAGMLMSAIPHGSFGWIQIKGIATLNTALVSGADGNALVMSATTDGTLKVAAAVTEVVAGAAIDASAKIVALDCPY